MKKRYAVCGVSQRAINMFINPIYKKFDHLAEVVALLDPDSTRFKICEQFAEHTDKIPNYFVEEFDKMLTETKPDAMIVTGADYTHVDYIIKGLEHNLEVISEKPMVTTAADCHRVLEAEKKSKGKVICTFNYRYPSVHRKIREIILEGKLGRITSIDLNWYVDTFHGASYFKRWNRTREKSGGLSIHKCTHHFDIVNWLLEQKPLEVHAFGSLNYFGKDGELNPSRKDGRHCGECDEREKCRYYMRWSTRTEEIVPPDDHVKDLSMKRSSAAYSNYRPDMCIFDSEINIEDTYVVNVRYDKGTLLNYSVNFSCPFEGYRLAINGTQGRLETQEWHAPKRVPFSVPEAQTIEYFPMFGSKETIHTVSGKGGHGGGDPLLLEDIILGPDPQRSYEILAGAKDAAESIFIGEAVWKSIKEGRSIKCKNL
jgi:predicted dehydrogenase